MINQESLDNYRKKFEEISSTRKSRLRDNKIPVKLKDWDKLVYQDYPELVASLIYSLQEFMDYQEVEETDCEHFLGSKD